MPHDQGLYSELIVPCQLQRSKVETNQSDHAKVTSSEYLIGQLGGGGGGMKRSRVASPIASDHPDHNLQLLWRRRR